MLSAAAMPQLRTPIATLATHCSNLGVVDLDGDRAPEVFVGVFDGGANFFSPHTGTFLRVSLQSGQTDVVDRPRDAATRVSGSSVCPVAFADLDRDDRVDLVALDGASELVVVLRQPSPRVLRARAPDAALRAIAPLDGPPGSEPVILVGAEDDFTEDASNEESRAQVGRDPAGNLQIVLPPGERPGTRLYAWTLRAGALVPLESPALHPREPLMAMSVSVRRRDDGYDEAIFSADFREQLAIRRTAAGLVDTSRELGVNVYAHGMGGLLGDIDEDGVDDLILSSLGVLHFRGARDGSFSLLSDRSAISARERFVVAWGGALADLDNNGHLDVALSVSSALWERPEEIRVSLLQRHLGGPLGDGYHPIFLGVGGGALREHWLPFDHFGAEAGRAYAMVAEDLDHDGRLELLMAVARAEPPAYGYRFHPTVMRLEVSASGRRDAGLQRGLTVRLPPRLAGVGTQASLVCAGGARISRTIYGAEGAGGPWRPSLHFGCGNASSYADLTITPRDGAPLRLGGGPLGRAVYCDERGCEALAPRALFPPASPDPSPDRRAP